MIKREDVSENLSKYQTIENIRSKYERI